MLTKEDKKKIDESFKRKGPLMAKMRPLLNDLRKSDTKNSVGLRIENNAKNYPDDIALYFEDKKYSHKEYNEWCNRYANYFLNLGLKKGNVVIVFMEDRPELLFTIGGLAKIGVISSLINTKQRESPLVHCILHAPGNAFLIGEELIQPFEDIKSRLELDDIQKSRIFFVPDNSEINCPAGYINLEEALKNADIINPATTPEIMCGDTFSYIFTSGTTGLPKAAIMKHGIMIMGSYMFGPVLLELEPGTKAILYDPTPLFHSNGLGYGLGFLLAEGSGIALKRKFSASQFWDDTRKYNAICFNYVGEICRYLYNQPPKPDDADNPVKHMIGSGLRYDIWKPFKKRFGIKTVMELYGASEQAHPVFMNLHNLDETCGFSQSPYAIVKYDFEADEPIRNEKGFMVKIKKGETGLVLGEIENPKEFYLYKDKKATEKKILHDVFKKGDMWLNCGDLLKDIGYKHIQFVDRLGDTFRWKSENVSTDEVENVISSFEKVQQNAVYGVLIPGTEGRAGMVSLVKKGENFDFEAFLSYLKQYLPSHAIPIFVRVQKELDLTATLKIIKGPLKNESFNIDEVSDPIYVLLPKSSGYVPLTKEIYEGISEGKYAF